MRIARGKAAADVARTRIARDLLLLADLLDHEPDRESVVALWARCYDGLLEATPYGPELRDAVNRFCDSLTEIPTCFDTDAGDALLADFRRIGVADRDHGGARPSAKRDLDSQNLHAESLALHQWASLHGISADSGLSADGCGVAVELRRFAYLVAADGVAAPADKLQQHLGRCLLDSVDGLAAEVAAHSGTHFFQKLGGLTAAYVHELEQRFASGVLDRPDSTTSQKRTATMHFPDPRGNLRASSGAADAP